MSTVKTKFIKSKGTFILQCLSVKGKAGDKDRYFLKRISIVQLIQREFRSPDYHDWARFINDCEHWAALATEGFGKIECPDISWLYMPKGKPTHEFMINLDVWIRERITDPRSQLRSEEVVVELISNWYPQGSLKTYSYEYLSRDPTGVSATVILCRLADALGFIHSKGIVHGLLDTDCIIINQFHRPLLPMPIFRGLWDEKRRAPQFRAPEQRDGSLRQQINPKPPVDVYAWGVIAFDVLQHRRFKSIFNVFQSLISLCVHVDPDVRPSARQVSRQMRELVLSLTVAPS